MRQSETLTPEGRLVFGTLVGLVFGLSLAVPPVFDRPSVLHPVAVETPSPTPTARLVPA